MFNRMALIGVGLIGGSLARAVRRGNLVDSICAYVATDATARRALELGVVDEVAASPADAARGADLVVLATPMLTMPPLLEAVQEGVGEDCIITDVGSVKQSLIDDAAVRCPGLMRQFVPGHPIAGTENSGVDASFAELFDGKNVVLTPTAETDPSYTARVADLWRAIGSRVLTMTAGQHDAIFARTSHLPHLVAYSLVDFMAQEENASELFSMAAAGFYDFTRIASSDPVMWRDICLTNREALLDALSGYRDALERLEDSVREANGESIESVFESARAARNQGLARKQQEG